MLNHSQAIITSVPHVYLSTLPFLAESSLIRECYGNTLSSIPKLLDAGPTAYAQPLVYILDVGGTLSAFALFQDNRYALIALLRTYSEGGDTAYLKKIDLENGETVASSGSIGHGARISEIKIFADQKRLVSASHDQ